MVKLHKFGLGLADGGAADKNLLGGKGANLCEMAGLQYPVPPGVVIPTTAWADWNGTNDAGKDKLVFLLAEQVEKAFAEFITPHFGYLPLVSVRSGARVSMPGMMDTILNIGLTADNEDEWSKRLGEKCRADSFKRLLEMYEKTVGSPCPSGRLLQLAGAIEAVFRSWNSERAIEYRKIHGYPADWGTAVVVQTMVFGNMNDQSCTGVMFTRDPATGERKHVGEWLPNAQGEDVVAGVVNPRPLSQISEWDVNVAVTLAGLADKLEAHYREAQDIEFTVQNGELFLLQTRSAKRTAHAAFKIAHDLVSEGVIEKTDAVARVTAEQFSMLKRPMIDPKFKSEPTFVGIPASPGLVKGVAVFSIQEAMQSKGFVLIRKETTPDDFPAMARAIAILTSTGGATSHAAVVARGMNKAAVVGATDLSVYDDHAMVGNSITISQGDMITLDGATGRVWVNEEVPVIGGTLPVEAKKVVSWAVAKSTSMLAYETTKELRVPKSGRYYISLHALTTKAELRGIMKNLAAATETYGVLGFERPARETFEADKEYLKFFAVEGAVGSPKVTNAQIEALVVALNLSVLPKKMKKRWVVHLPSGTTLQQKEQVLDAGWKIVQPVESLKDLLAADGLIAFSPDFRARIDKEGVDLKEVIGVLEKAGRSVTEFGSVLDVEDFVLGALGK